MKFIARARIVRVACETSIAEMDPVSNDDKFIITAVKNFGSRTAALLLIPASILLVAFYVAYIKLCPNFIGNFFCRRHQRVNLRGPEELSEDTYYSEDHKLNVKEHQGTSESMGTHTQNTDIANMV